MWAIVILCFLLKETMEAFAGTQKQPLLHAAPEILKSGFVMFH